MDLSQVPPDPAPASTPAVSVVIAAYNAERWLGATIHSVLAQTFQDFELVVVDDGSTDATRSVIERFESDRIRYVYQPNRGISAARNTGVRAARGRYVALLDADDLFNPDKLARQVAALESDPGLGLVTCGYELIDAQGRRIGEERVWLGAPVIDIQTVLFWNPLLPSTLLIRRAWFERAGWFDESLRRYEDWDFAVRLALVGCRMGWVRELLLCYRRHTTNMSTAADLVPVATEAAVGFMTRLFERPDLPEDVHALRGPVFGNIYLDAAARAYGAGLGEQGREWLETALRYDPGLTTANPPHWVVSLSGHALTSLVRDWRAYIHVVAAHLPASREFGSWNKRRLAANVLAAQSFKMRHYRRPWRSRVSALAALALDPALLRNRGLVKLSVWP